MTTNRPSNPDAMWNLLLLTAAVAGGYVMMSSPLASNRPLAEKKWRPEPSDDVCVDARLWQDPIEAVEMHLHDLRAGASDCGGRGDDHVGLALGQWLVKALHPWEPGEENHPNAQAEPPGRILMLGAMTRGGIFPESREFRLRSRYAIATALTALGYTPQDAQRIGLMRVNGWECGPPCVRQATTDASPSEEPVESRENNDSDDCPKCYANVPYERYVRSKLLSNDGDATEAACTPAYDRVVVFWLNADQFGSDTYSRLHTLVTAVIKQTERFADSDPNYVSATCSACAGGIQSHFAHDVEVKLIGPDGSDALVRLFREEDKLYDPDPTEDEEGEVAALAEKIEVLIPWATAPEPLLEQYVGGDTLKQRLRKYDADRAAGSLTDSWQRNCSGPTYRRITGTDDILARALVDELRLRGITFWNCENGESPDCTGTNDRVVIITEADTSYGRSFPYQFAAAVNLERTSRSPQDAFAVARPEYGAMTSCDLLDATVLEGVASSPCRTRIDESKRTTWPKQVAVYRYLRGADGVVPGEQDPHRHRSPVAETTKGDRSETDPWRTRADRRAPVGPAQFDYIRRLAAQLREDFEDRELRAIGVCGTDVYDTLVILRALRDEFPQMVFFATDLDSRLEHPSNIHASHNLIIASHHDLQADVSFLTNRDACWRTWTSLRNPPAFRDTYQTATFEAAVSALTGKAPAERTLRQPYVYEIGRSGAYQLNDPLRSESLQGKARSVALALTALILLVTPFVSLGVATPLRRVVRGLLVVSIALIACCVMLAIVDHHRIAGEPFLPWEGISVWPTNIVRLTAGLLAVMFVLRGWGSLEENLHALAPHRTPQTASARPDPNHDAWVRRVLEGFVNLRLVRWLRARRFLARLARAAGPIAAYVLAPTRLPRYQYTTRGCSTATVPDALSLYAFYEARLPRLLRVTRTTALYFLFVLMIKSIFFSGVSINLGRGAVVMGLTKPILFFSVVAMLMLIFLTVDATRNCRVFINSVSERAPSWNVAGGGDAQTAPSRPVDEWHLMELIGRRTQAVNRLILMPMLVIILMVIARSSYFDNWGMPTFLMIVIGLNFSYAIGCAVLLRGTANRARRAATARLTDELVRSPGEEHDQLTDAIARVEAYDEGAFGPLTRQPFLRAILYPSSGLGAVALVEFLLQSG